MGLFRRRAASPPPERDDEAKRHKLADLLADAKARLACGEHADWAIVRGYLERLCAEYEEALHHVSTADADRRGAAWAIAALRRVIEMPALAREHVAVCERQLAELQGQAPKSTKEMDEQMLTFVR